MLVITLEKAVAPHSSTLAWKIPWMEEPDGLQSMGSLESDTTERLHFHFSLSCIGEGHGNPLQCSCLENPRDRGAWWAAVYGVAQSQTRLKRLSSSTVTSQSMPRIAGHYQKIGTRQEGIYPGSQREHSSAGTLILDFKPLDLGGNKFPFFKLPNVWCSVTTALGNGIIQ